MPRKITPSVFIIVLVCFFLPWINVSCQGQKVASFSGMQLVTGTTIEEPALFGNSQKKKVSGEPLAVIAFIAVLAGFGLSFRKGGKAPICPTAAGIIGAILLLMLKSKVDKDIFHQTGGMLQTNYDAGYYLALISFIIAAGTSAYSMINESTVGPPIRQNAADLKFCSHCGAGIERDSIFCVECGSSLK